MASWHGGSGPAFLDTRTRIMKTSKVSMAAFGLALLSVLTVACVPSVPPSPTPLAPAGGAVFVGVGFGAVTSTPYQCAGGGTVTITPRAPTGGAGEASTQRRPFSYSGLSQMTPPACRTSVTFSNLAPGTWLVTDGIATCAAEVRAGQPTTVNIFNSACQ